MCLSIRVEIIHMSKFEPGTVEKNSSTIGPPAGIEPTPVRCRCTALTTKLYGGSCRSKRNECVFRLVMPANKLR